MRTRLAGYPVRHTWSEVNWSRCDARSCAALLVFVVPNTHPDSARRILLRTPTALDLRRSPSIAYPGGASRAIRPRCTVIAEASYVQRILLARLAIDAAQRTRSEVKNQPFGHFLTIHAGEHAAHTLLTLPKSLSPTRGTASDG